MGQEEMLCKQGQELSCLQLATTQALECCQLPRGPRLGPQLCLRLRCAAGSCQRVTWISASL